MRHFGIFLKQGGRDCSFAKVLQDFENLAREQGVMLCFEESNAYGLRGFSLEEIAHKCEMLISLGGDGTLIATLHKINTLPIFGVNAGNLGFLTGVALKDFFSFFPLLLRGEYEIKNHAMLSVYINQKKVAMALNEVLISKKTFPAMIKIEAEINQKMFNHYYCDGLIVATPTGSTAYNISAGGSVVYPYCKNILLTPLAPHSLTQRPMILGGEMRLDFVVKQDSQIIIDGQKVFDFSPQSRLQIGYDGEDARLVYPKDWDYFALLREKFRWGN